LLFLRHPLAYIVFVGSKTYDGVRFSAYSSDHWPPHVHGFYAGVQVVVDLLIETRQVRLSGRKKNISPRNAKNSDVNHVLRIATKYFDELVQLWETA